MSLPTYDQLIEPLLRYLAAHPEGVTTSAAYDAVAEASGLTEVQRQELLPSGRQPVYKNRIGWAQDRLKRRKLSFSPKHGVWQITPLGAELVHAHPEPLSQERVQWLASVEPEQRLHQSEAPRPEGATEVLPVGQPKSPDDRLEEALDELNETVAAELLDIISRSTPAFFEALVLDLLHAMGYGKGRSDLQRVGGSGDGGIDGVISLDRLGLEKVYVQAKRWKNSVGRPEIQGFYGALAGQRAHKGVFITTSVFTAQAYEFASSVERIVLVDGQTLAQLMIDHGVGVSHRTLRVAKVDSDYFEE
jgi:restriction system protein